MKDEKQVTGWSALLDRLQPLEQALLVALANGMEPMSKVTIDRLSQIRGVTASLSKVRTAINKLRKAGILAKPSGDKYVIEDRLFADYILSNSVGFTNRPTRQRR
jgi:hypothetical protein